jgi:hypothetical protein
MNFRSSFFLLAALFWVPAAALGQTMVNPDISAIADVRYVYRDDVAAALAGENNASFEFKEIELALTGYLNPYMRADFYLGMHGTAGDFEVEEGYASVVRGLPVQLRFGKYLLDFGKINTQHPHQWGWLERPLMHRTAFGHHGAGVIGAGASRLQPIGDTALTLSVSGFRSDFFDVPDHEHDEEGAAHEHVHGAGGAADIGGSGRLSIFRSLTEDTHIELGASALAARYEQDHGLDARLAGADVKLRWRPDTYRAFNLIAEALWSDREVAHHHHDEEHEEDILHVENVRAWGAFAAAELRFRKMYDAGLYADWTEDAFVAGAKTSAYGAYVGFMPVEETARFSVVYRREESDFYDGSSSSVTFQVLWSLGPHKPHPF